MSIRLRLTLLYSFLLAVTLSGFGVLLYITMEHSTRVFMQDTLRAEMDGMLRTSTAPVNTLLLPSPNVGVGESYWQACDSTGKVMARTDNLGSHSLPLSPDGLQQVQAGQPIYEVTEVNSVSMLVFSHPVTDETGATTGILQVARSVEEQGQAMHSLQILLIGGGVITLLIGAGIGWLMAGVSLRPIDSLTRTAHSIGVERDFSRRVTHTGPPDEVGRLATTFNEMLAALEGAYQQVAQMLQAQRWFVADASHELRTPLTTLRGNLALLNRQPAITEEDRKAVLADIVDENERMIRLVNDLMMLARAEHQTTVELEPVPLGDLLAEVERQARPLKPTIHFVLKPAADVSVLARRDALKQVMLILLDNAFKFTANGGTVEINTVQRGSRLAIQVRDTGIGIARDKLPHIFRRFYRADESRHGGGYGLGLAIARALVEQQGGMIEVESEAGQGSTFTVTLALAASAPARDTIAPTGGTLTPAFSFTRSTQL